MSTIADTQGMREPPAAQTDTAAARAGSVTPSRGFWADAWARLRTRPIAVLAMCWLGIIALAALFAPLVASGHPLIMREIDSAGRVARTTSPLFANLSATDLLLLIGAAAGAVWLLLPLRISRAQRGQMIGLAALQAAATVILGAMTRQWFRAPDALLGAGCTAAAGALPLFAAGLHLRMRARAIMACLVAVACAILLWRSWQDPLVRFDYRAREAAGKVRCTYTLVPFSPQQSDTSLYLKPPGSRLAAIGPGDKPGPLFILGTDPFGQDVLSQLLHACRLAISIGLVSTGIAFSIGITVGALAGYCGGWVDTVLQRLIETFMAIPVLFLLIVAAGVLPSQMRSTYITMAIIGAVTWTGAARFTRAEFYRLRAQDFIQAARAAGLPARSIMFRHMLPNGATPVLVDASFSIAAAILAEATLSFLGLGPIDQASWGKLLSSATGTTGTFVWWLAVFPGLAIFLTVVSYNLIGEALRDAIDPNMRAGTEARRYERTK